VNNYLAMSEPGPNITIESTKSMPCIELSSPILDGSDHSFASYKSFNTVHEREPIEIRTNVKALIDKHRSFQENLLNAKGYDFKTKQKSFTNARKNVCTSNNDCIEMQGDTKQVENVENIVRL